MSQGFPIAIDDLMASVVEILKDQGAAREIGVIVASDVDTEWFQEDYGTNYWGILLALDLPVYSRLSEAERNEVERTIDRAASPFFRAFQKDELRAVNIVPRAVKNEGWRDQANEWLRGAGVNNEGRVRSDNIASRQHDGLLFRSQPEINLYVALKARGVTFAPLPVFIRGGTTYARFEPDFVVIKDGVVMVIEVDGDTYHRETPVEAAARLQPLDHEGAKVERVRAEECAGPEAAKVCAEKLLRILEKRIGQSRR